MTGRARQRSAKPTLSRPTTRPALSGGFLITGQYVMNAGGSGRARVHPRRRRRLRLVVQHRQRRDRRAHELRRHAHVDQQRQRPEPARRQRAPRDDGRHDRRGPVEPVHRPEPPADRAARRDGRVLRLRRRTAATTSRSARPTARSRPSSTRRPRTARPAPATSTTSSTRRRTTRWSSPTSITPHVTKVKRTDGSTVWVLNGTGNQTFTGDTWPGGEHGIHILGLDDFLIFNNNSSVAGSTSAAAPATARARSS